MIILALNSTPTALAKITVTEIAEGRRGVEAGSNGQH